MMVENLHFFESVSVFQAKNIKNKPVINTVFESAKLEQMQNEIQVIANCPHFAQLLTDDGIVRVRKF